MHRLPPAERQARLFRMRRALNLSMKKISLEPSEWTKPEEVKKLKTSIFLRLSIITFFFLGCFSGGISYQFLEIQTLFIAAFVLLIAQWYDFLRLKFHLIKRKTFH